METTKDKNEETLQAIGVQPELPLLPGELESIKAENERLRDEARGRLARDTVLLALGQAGAREPELLYRAVKGDLQFGDDGSVQNAAALIGRLKREFSDAFGHSGSSIDGGAVARSLRYLTKEMLTTMTAAEIAKLDWAEVKSVLAER